MATREYEAPRITEIGSLHELTLQTIKDATGTDGTIFQPNPNVPGIPLGPVSP